MKVGNDFRHVSEFGSGDPGSSLFGIFIASPLDQVLCHLSILESSILEISNSNSPLMIMGGGKTLIQCRNTFGVEGSSMET